MSLDEFNAPDTLRGAEEIAVYIYGDRKHRRKVYHLVETSRLPVFRFGAKICMRRSTLAEWVRKQEVHAARNAAETVGETFDVGTAGQAARDGSSA